MLYSLWNVQIISHPYSPLTLQHSLYSRHIARTQTHRIDWLTESGSLYHSASDSLLWGILASEVPWNGRGTATKYPVIKIAMDVLSITPIVQLHFVGTIYIAHVSIAAIAFHQCHKYPSMIGFNYHVSLLRGHFHFFTTWLLAGTQVKLKLSFLRGHLSSRILRSGRSGQQPWVYGPEYAQFISLLTENHQWMLVLPAISLNGVSQGTVGTSTWPWISTLYCGIWHHIEWLVATSLYYRTHHVYPGHIHTTTTHRAAASCPCTHLTYILLAGWTLHLTTQQRATLY